MAGLLGLCALALGSCGGSSGNATDVGGDDAGSDVSTASDLAGGDAKADAPGDTAALDSPVDEGKGDAAAGTGGAGGSMDAGTGGAVVDASSDAQPDAPSEEIGRANCQAGEACTGTASCVASRCIRNQEETCHCVNNSLFCGPAPCGFDGGVDLGGPRDTGVPACVDGTSTGDTCVPATDRSCTLPCNNGRRRECFCSPTTDEWICTAPMRC